MFSGCPSWSPASCPLFSGVLWPLLAGLGSGPRANASSSASLTWSRKSGRKPWSPGLSHGQPGSWWVAGGPREQGTGRRAWEAQAPPLSAGGLLGKQLRHRGSPCSGCPVGPAHKQGWRGWRLGHFYSKMCDHQALLVPLGAAILGQRRAVKSKQTHTHTAPGSWMCHWRTVWCSLRGSTSPRLSFLICKAGRYHKEPWGWCGNDMNRAGIWCSH